MRIRSLLRLALLPAVFAIGCGDDKPDDNDDPPPDEGPYNLVFNGSAYTPHNGKVLKVALIKASDQSLVGEIKSTTLSDGTFSFTWTDGLQKSTAYELHFFADVDGDDVCDAPSGPSDHAWKKDIAGVTQDTTVTETHNTNFTNVCSTFNGGGGGSTFDLVLNGTGYTPHNNQTIKAALLDGTTMVGSIQTQTVSGTGTFSFTWTDGIQSSKTYTVRYYADHNSNSACDAPPTDHAWEHTFSTGVLTADRTESVTHNTNFTNVCSTFPGTPSNFDLTLNGTGFTPHNAQTVKAAVLDGTTVVGAVQTGTVTSGNFTFTWTGIAQSNKTYTVRYYADHNSSGTCNAPPTDHAWETTSATATLSAAHTVSVTHNTTFTDVCATFP